MSSWEEKAKYHFKHYEPWLAVLTIKEGIKNKLNWKQKAKELIAEANVIEAIALTEANGVKIGNLLTRMQKLEDESEKHVKNKTQFAPGEYAKHSAEFSKICWDLLQKIDGTNKPMPEYLK